MPRAATSRLKFNPPLGRMPVLQFMTPAELSIDQSYQRSIEAQDSQSLIRRLASHWNWDLCQPLVVSRRPDGALFVIDGQCRLCAARQRGDIMNLPCVIVDYSDPADEAASFVHLNQQRRPLNKIDLFKAAVASEDPGAVAILGALNAAKLTVAPHSNYISWKPGMLANIGGIEVAVKKHGLPVTAAALKVLGKAWPKEVLRYAGTVFPGIAAICAEEKPAALKADMRLSRIAGVVGARSQMKWRGEVAMARARDLNLSFVQASENVMRDAWAIATGVPVSGANATDNARGLKFTADDDGMCWCEQCDMRVSLGQAKACSSRFCSLRMAD